MSSPHQQPDLVSLLLQSKKALQHGEQLCSRAHAVSNASARAAIDVVALDAKVRWVSEAVSEQLKLVASVAKSIEEKRLSLTKQVQAWDALRMKHSNVLDSILESLGSQLVPPDFYESVSADSSLFGSQHSDNDDKDSDDADDADPHRKASGGKGKDRGNNHQRSNGRERSTSVSHSPSSTLRGGAPLVKGKQREVEKEKETKWSKMRLDRKYWKSLRDFVDDQGIEDVLDAIENDRTGLDDIISKTDEYPGILYSTIRSIRASFPELQTPPNALIEEIVNTQETISSAMAVHLDSLTSHFEQMENAVRETEAGEAFGEEDLRDMNRDTDELPSIMAELEESTETIETYHEKLQANMDLSRRHLSMLGLTLDDLDELGDIMSEMLETQDSVEAECEDKLAGLHNHLLTLEHLHDRFVSYQLAFNKLVLELARRRQYREAVDNIVRGMMAQLDAMSEEENQVRTHFNAEYGAHLPEDICLCVGNAPTRWEVVPYSGEALEFLPVIDDELAAEAKDRIMNTGSHDTPTGAILSPDSL